MRPDEAAMNREDQIQARIKERHMRFLESQQGRGEGNAVRGGIICGMLGAEAAATCDPIHRRQIGKLQANFLEETSAVKAFINLRGRLRVKLRAAGIATMLCVHLRMQAKKRKKGLLGRRVPRAKPQKKLSPRSKAKVFMKKVQKGPIHEESPAVLALRSKQQQDLKTAEAKMFDSGELTRLKELRARKKLDDVEKEVLARLEAKMQGMIFTAELERKEKENQDRKIQRAERIRENEKKYAQAKVVAQAQREHKIRKFLAPIRKAKRKLRKLRRKLLTGRALSASNLHQVADETNHGPTLVSNAPAADRYRAQVAAVTHKIKARLSSQRSVGAAGHDDPSLVASPSPDFSHAIHRASVFKDALLTSAAESTARIRRSLRPISQKLKLPPLRHHGATHAVPSSSSDGAASGSTEAQRLDAAEEPLPVGGGVEEEKCEPEQQPAEEPPSPSHPTTAAPSS